jgi:hypothetical protein
MERIEVKKEMLCACREFHGGGVRGGVGGGVAGGGATHARTRGSTCPLLPDVNLQDGLDVLWEVLALLQHTLR